MQQESLRTCRNTACTGSKMPRKLDRFCWCQRMGSTQTSYVTHATTARILSFFLQESMHASLVFTLTSHFAYVYTAFKASHLFCLFSPSSAKAHRYPETPPRREPYANARLRFPSKLQGGRMATVAIKAASFQKKIHTHEKPF